MDVLEVLVQRYIRDDRPPLRALLDWFHHQPFDIALIHAAIGIDGDGTKQGRAERIPQSVLVTGYKAMLPTRNDILACQ
ncbi:MAG: hypothetical protein ACYDCO_05520 [Armatimonadota bacterium]